MRPFLFSVPGTELRVLAMPVCLAVAVAMAAAVTAMLGRRHAGFAIHITVAAVVLVACFGLAGGRLHFVVAYPELYQGRPLAWLSLFEGGRHVPGVVVGLVVGASVTGRLFRLPFLVLGDCGAIGVAVAIAIARVGCLLHGCCFGTACQGWWCVTYPPSAPAYNTQLPQGLIALGAARSLPVHPLPLYFVAGALVAAALMRWRLRRPHPDGEIMLLGLVLLGATSALLEPLRFDHAARRYLFGLPQLQILQGCIAALAGLGLVVLRAAPRANGWRHRSAQQRAPARLS